MKFLYTNEIKYSNLCHYCDARVYSEKDNYFYHDIKCKKFAIGEDNKVLLFGLNFTNISNISIISEKLSFILKLYPNEIIDSKDVLDKSDVINT